MLIGFLSFCTFFVFFAFFCHPKFRQPGSPCGSRSRVTGDGRRAEMPATVLLGVERLGDPGCGRGCIVGSRTGSSADVFCRAAMQVLQGTSAVSSSSSSLSISAIHTCLPRFLSFFLPASILSIWHIGVLCRVLELHRRDASRVVNR